MYTKKKLQLNSLVTKHLTADTVSGNIVERILANVSLASVGVGESLVSDGVGPDMAIKSVVGTANLTIVDLGNELQFDAPGAALTTLASAGGGETLVNDGTGPALAVKGLTQGNNIVMTSSATAVTISGQNQIFAIFCSTGTVANNNFLRQDGNAGTENTSQYIAVRTGTLTNLIIALDTAPGVGNSRTLTVRVNGIDTALTTTISDANTTGTSSANVAIMAGQFVSIQSTHTGSASRVYASLEIFYS